MDMCTRCRSCHCLGLCLADSGEEKDRGDPVKRVNLLIHMSLCLQIIKAPGETQEAL